jgi:hypothetical protein
MSQRFISFSMGIYSSDRTLLSGFFLKKHLEHSSFAMGAALGQNCPSVWILDSGFRLEILQRVML